MNPAMMHNAGGFIGGVPGNMQQQQQQQQQQQAQQNPNAALARTIQQILQQVPLEPGWRQGVDFRERYTWIKQIIDNLRLLRQATNAGNPSNDLSQVLHIATNFEMKALAESPNKEAYGFSCRQKIGEIRHSLEQQASAQGRPGLQPNSFSQVPQMSQNPSYHPQLGHQMQASPIPPSRAQVMAMNANAAMIPPNGLGMAPSRDPSQNPFMQNQLPPQNAQTMQIKANPDAVEQQVLRLAHEMSETTSPEGKRQIMEMLFRNPGNQIQNLKAKGIDVLALYFKNQAMKRMQEQQAQRHPEFTGNVPINHPAMHPQGQQNPASIAGARNVPGGAQTPGASFVGDLDHFKGLQAEGVRSQMRGQQVVPAGNGQGINPEQFRMKQFANNPQMGQPAPQGRPNPPFAQQQTQPTPNARVEAQKQIPPKSQPDTANNVPTQAQLQAQARARAQQQQMGMSRQPGQPGLQGMAQGGTPMQMLNRPVGTNVQGTPPSQLQATPQPRPPSQAVNVAQKPGALGPNHPPDGMQQNIVAQNPPGQNQSFNGLPPAIQQLLRQTPRSQWKDVLARISQQRVLTNPQRLATGAPSMSHALSQPGQNLQTTNGQLATDNATTSLPMQHSVSAGAPMAHDPNSSPAPGQQMMFMSQQQQQPPPLQQPQLRRPIDGARPIPAQRPGQIQMAQGAGIPPNASAWMDNQPVPLSLLQHLTSRGPVPPQIKTWSQLKQFFAQNPADRVTLDKIMHVQVIQYNQHLNNLQRQNPNRAVIDGNRPPPTANAMPGTQAAALMQPSASQPGFAPANQVPQGMMGPMVYTAEVLQRFRQTNPALAAHSDEDLRNHLISIRQGDMQRRMALSQQTAGGQNFTFMPGQTTARPPPTGGPRQIQQPPQQQHPTTPAAKPTMVNPQQPRPAVAGGRTAVNATPKAAPRVPVATAGPSNQQAGKGVKRANDDSSVGVATSAVTTTTNVPPRAVGTLPGQVFRKLTEEQLSTLSVQEQKVYRERQQQHQLLIETCRRLEEEATRSMKPMTTIDLDPPSRERMIALLLRDNTKQMMTRLNHFLMQYFLITKKADLMKRFFVHKRQMSMQYTEESVKIRTWVPKNVFTITPEHVESILKDFTQLCQGLARIAAGQAVPETAAPAEPTTEANGSHQLSAVNLKKLSDMQAAQRGKRPAQDVPPAPTAAQPPFPFSEGSPRGPQGTPQYATAGPNTKREDLKLPSKRQKKTHPENTAPTPITARGAAGQSPQVAKVQKVDNCPFKCSIVGCKFVEKGFTTLRGLEEHMDSDHRPVEELVSDPVEAFLENARLGLGLDANGKPKSAPIAKPEVTKSVPMQKTASKTGVGSKVSTPMPAAAAMARANSQASGNKAASPGITLQQAHANPQMELNGTVSMADLDNAFGDMINVPGISVTQHDPLSVSYDVSSIAEEFMRSDVWTKIQAQAVNYGSASVPSSKSTASPAQNSDPGQAGSSDTSPSKGDDAFIKIDAEDTELAEEWALPELTIEAGEGFDGDETMPDAAAAVDKSWKTGDDEFDAWIKMDVTQVESQYPTGTLDERIAKADLGFDWKDFDWDQVLAEEKKNKSS